MYFSLTTLFNYFSFIYFVSTLSLKSMMSRQAMRNEVLATFMSDKVIVEKDMNASFEWRQCIKQSIMIHEQDETIDITTYIKDVAVMNCVEIYSRVENSLIATYRTWLMGDQLHVFDKDDLLTVKKILGKEKRLIDRFTEWTGAYVETPESLKTEADTCMWELIDTLIEEFYGIKSDYTILAEFEVYQELKEFHMKKMERLEMMCFSPNVY